MKRIGPNVVTDTPAEEEEAALINILHLNFTLNPDSKPLNFAVCTEVAYNGLRFLETHPRYPDFLFDGYPDFCNSFVTWVFSRTLPKTS